MLLPLEFGVMIQRQQKYTEVFAIGLWEKNYIKSSTHFMQLAFATHKLLYFGIVCLFVNEIYNLKNQMSHRFITKVQTSYIAIIARCYI